MTIAKFYASVKINGRTFNRDFPNLEAATEFADSFNGILPFQIELVEIYERLDCFGARTLVRSIIN